jgi:hypothetical protein
MSYGKFSRKSEVLTYRQHFAKTWQQFIIENFEDAAHAAFVFKVDPSTADNWFDGLNAPQGWVVGRALADPNLRDAVVAALGVSP